MTKNEQLKNLMKRYHLNHKLVALMTQVKVWRVDAWCLDSENERYLEIDDKSLDRVVAVCKFIYPFYFEAADVYSKLLKNQETLGKKYEDKLYDKIFDLYKK